MFHNIQNSGKDYIGYHRLYVSVAEFANEYAKLLARKIYMQIVVVLEHKILISIHCNPVDQSI